MTDTWPYEGELVCFDCIKADLGSPADDLAEYDAAFPPIPSRDELDRLFAELAPTPSWGGPADAAA